MAGCAGLVRRARPAYSRLASRRHAIMRGLRNRGASFGRHLRLVLAAEQGTRCPARACARGRRLVGLVGSRDHAGRGIRHADLARTRTGPRARRRVDAGFGGLALGSRRGTPDAADRGALVPVRLDNARLPIDFRAVHTTDLDDWAENSSSPAFRSLCKALESKLGPAAKAKADLADKRPAVGVCVLPFVNMRGDPEQEYFTDGISRGHHHRRCREFTRCS